MKKDVPIELAGYVKNHSVESFRRKGVYNAWSANFLKGPTRAVKHLYIMKGIDRGYKVVATRRSSNNASEEKSNIPRALKNKLSHN